VIFMLRKSAGEIQGLAAAGAAANREAALARLAGLKLHVADSLCDGRSLRAAADWLIGLMSAVWNHRVVRNAPSLLKGARALGLR
jgi:hypothetical protein